MNTWQRRQMLAARGDRLIAFFDAVLAIAITMLALELTIPSFGDAASAGDFFVAFTAYLISFVSLASLWYFHSWGMAFVTITSNPSEYFAHFLLMFLVTLFQPATKALTQYGSDPWVRVLYVGLFIAINLVNLLCLTLSHVHHRRADEASEALQQRLREKEQDPQQAASLSEEQRLAMWAAYYVTHGDEAFRHFHENMSDEQREELQAYSDRIEEERRGIVLSSGLMIVSICCAVIAMVFSYSLCYLFLAAGIVAVFFVRRFIYHNQEETEEQPCH